MDIGIPLEVHDRVKKALARIPGFRSSSEEPSVWMPESPKWLEVNFMGIDASILDAADSRVFEDPDLPLMVFGPLSLLRPGKPVMVEGMAVPVPFLAGLLLEKLVTERSGVKGDRDLLVALGLLLLSRDDDLEEAAVLFRTLPPELRYAVRSNLTVLSLMEPVPGMPDPRPHRRLVAALLRRLEEQNSGEDL